MNSADGYYTVYQNYNLWDRKLKEIIDDMNLSEDSPLHKAFQTSDIWTKVSKKLQSFSNFSQNLETRWFLGTKRIHLLLPDCGSVFRVSSSYWEVCNLSPTKAWFSFARKTVATTSLQSYNFKSLRNYIITMIIF